MAEEPTPESIAQAERLNRARELLRIGVLTAQRRLPIERGDVSGRVSKEGGAIGRVLGEVRYHAGNIAFVAIFGLLLLLLVTIIGLFYVTLEVSSFEGMKSIALALLTLMGTILGYIFGRGGPPSDGPSND